MTIQQALDQLKVNGDNWALLAWILEQFMLSQGVDLDYKFPPEETT